ncbi:hypothetical protein [Cellulomonas soli]
MTTKSADLARTLTADLDLLGGYVARIESLSGAVEENAGQLRLIAGDLGVTGSIEEAAAGSLDSQAKDGLTLCDDVAAISTSVARARDALVVAQEAYRDLPQVGLNGWQKAEVLTAEIVVPGVGTLVGSAATAYLTAQNSHARETAADQALRALEGQLTFAADAMAIGTVKTNLTDAVAPMPASATTPTGTTTGGSTGRPIGAATSIGSGSPTTALGTGSAVPTTGLAPGSTLSGVLVGGGSSTWADPTPAVGGSTSADGRTIGGTVPGGSVTGALPGAWSGSGSGFGATAGTGGLGGAVTGGALAGGLAVGATAVGLTGLSRSASAGGLLGGAGLGGTSGSGLSSTGTSSGVLGGSRSSSGSATALRGASGSSLAEGTASGGTASTGASATRSTASSSGMMPGGGAAGGGGADKRRRKGGGLIAPGIDEDDARLPVSLGAGARAGSRENLPVLAPFEEPDDTW